MADQELIFNNLAEGIALGTTELCDILKYDNCDLDVKAKQSLINKLADEKTEDARIPAQERRKTLVEASTIESLIGSVASFTFDNTGKNLVSFSVACTKLEDDVAVSPYADFGTGNYVFTEEGETISAESPEGGYLHGDLVVTVPATDDVGTNVLKVIFNYEEV